jgi:HEAT repeat protein
MPTEQPTGNRALKKEVLRLLQSQDLAAALDELAQIPARKAINPLFSFLLHEDEKVRWRAISAMGFVVSRLAELDREASRVIMRRLMWSLNDESGGIGWGAPEAIAEILAMHAGLAEEFGPILISYLNPEGNFLEYSSLQKGLMWGVARMACARPRVMAPAVAYLAPYLESPDPETRGLAAWAAGLLGAERMRPLLQALCSDAAVLRLYSDHTFAVFTVGNLASEALALLDGTREPQGGSGLLQGTHAYLGDFCLRSSPAQPNE